MRKLLLQDVNYQNKLNNIDVTPPQGVSKLQYIENRLIQEINSKNPRLHVESIEYLDLNTEFPEFIGGDYSALIVDEEKVATMPTRQMDDSRYYIDNSGNVMRQRIMAYVFTSPATKDEGRNITVTQDIFPRLLDHIEKYIHSPSFTYSNHPFYYISLMNPVGGLQASILANYAKLMLLGIEFIELFPIGVNLSNIPNDVPGVVSYIANLPASRKNAAAIQSTGDYQFDVVNKSLMIFSGSLSVNITTGMFGARVKASGRGNATFNGSSEKFYWLDVLSMFELALRNNYEIDYNQLWSWYNQNRALNSFGNSDKFSRFESLLKYFDKKTLKG